MDISQKFAYENRERMAYKILEFLELNLSDFEYFHTIHNYINMEDKILRKGSISAYENEEVLIPINMRDGSILAKGKSNEEYNYSAPHGAGRLFSRKEAREIVTLENFKEAMKGIYSTSVQEGTLDESPFAYKSIKDIIPNILPTVDIIKILKPIYNFKACKNRSRLIGGEVMFKELTYEEAYFHKVLIELGYNEEFEKYIDYLENELEVYEGFY